MTLVFNCAINCKVFQSSLFSFCHILIVIKERDIYIQLSNTYLYDTCHIIYMKTLYYYLYLSEAHLEIWEQPCINYQ